MSDTPGRFMIKISKESKVQRKVFILTHFFISILTAFAYNFDIFIEFEIDWQAIVSKTCSMLLQFIQQMNVIPIPNTLDNNFHSSFGSCCFLLVLECILFRKLKMYHVNSPDMPNVNKSYATQHLVHCFPKSAFQKEMSI